MKTISYIFTYDYSAATWEESGTLNRELLLFNEIAREENYKFKLITYGGKRDFEILKNQKLFEVIPVYSICKKHKNKYLRFAYSFLIPFKISDQVRDSDLIYQNQLHGSWVSIILKFLIKKPLLIRTGYDAYLFSIKDKKNILIRWFYKILTNLSLKFSDLYTITSASDYKFLTNTFRTNKIKITRNWTQQSKNIPIENRYETRILCVGRLVYQKNYEYFFDELAKLDTFIEVDIIGSGPLQNSLKEKAASKNLKVNFIGKINHEELLSFYANYKFYVLPSLYEGNPKTLIEAMGAGCIVIASDISNNTEIVSHNENGFIFDLSSSSFANLFTDISKLSNEDLKKIQTRGILNIENEYSLEKVKKEVLEDFKALFV